MTPKNKSEIAVIDTSAGLCLMQMPEDGNAPCPTCLVRRLEEAGFALRSEISVQSEDDFRTELTAPLPARDGRAAPVVRVDSKSNRATLHTLLPVPDCPACSARQIRSRRNPPLRDAVLFDPLLGIESCLEWEGLDHSADSLCFTVIGRVHVPPGMAWVGAHAQSSTAPDARAAQLGEAVERYVALRPEVHRLTTANWDDLPRDKIPLELLNGFDREQLSITGYRRVTADTRLAWIRGRLLRGGREIFVPAAWVYLARSWNREENRINALISHGLAAHKSLLAARENAMLEVYERFHTTRAWHEQNFGIPLDTAVVPRHLRPILDRIRRSKLRVHLRSLTGPSQMPVVLAAVAGGCYPWLRIGTAARRTTPEAAERALLEACGAWQFARRKQDEPYVARLAPVTSAAAHVDYYSTAKRSARIVNILEKEEARPRRNSTEEGTVDIRKELLRLVRHAVEVIITTPDCRACGFEVVKIIAPGLPLLHFGRVGTPRLFAARFGLPRVATPHPYL